uniref:Uncharacterized protein n=1 Tax=Rhizophora mucronata TaxID=61149 RepID=A0A2P2J370_RHIMU
MIGPAQFSQKLAKLLSKDKFFPAAFLLRSTHNSNAAVFDN